MSLDARDPELAAALERLASYARESVARAAELAHGIHADEVTPEHLLAALMLDEDSAACEVVEHAFADPATLHLEALAISPGLLVVASDATRAFSPRAVEALTDARRNAAEAGRTEVSAVEVFTACLPRLEQGVREDLRGAGLAEEQLARDLDEQDRGAEPVPADGPLFRRFSTTAKQALSAASRLADGGDQRIAPAHLVLALTKSEPRLEQRGGLSFLALRATLAGRLVDASSRPAAALPAADELVELLARAEEGADTLGLLRTLQRHGVPELAHILVRNKVTAELLDRAQGAFRDP